MKILIVGLGSIALKHIHVLRSIDSSVIIYALRSKKNAVKNDGIINIYSLEEVKKLNIDFIILSNPTGYHFQYLDKIKELKKPLFIEKPLFDRIGKEQEELINNIIQVGIPNYVACNLRFLDCIIKVKDVVKSERVNEVNVYCGSFLPDWRPNVDYRTTYSANIEMGGGVHLDLIHELDYVYWLFGEPQNIKSTFSCNSSLDITAFDYTNYLWIYNKFSVNIILNYYRRDAKRELEIVCEAGTYSVDLLQNIIYYNNQIVFKSHQRIINTYEKQMRFFIEKVIQNNDNFNSIDQAYKILKLCLTV